MSANAPLSKYRENDIILREGELKDEMYKIISGKVIVYLNYGKDDEYLIGILSEQRCFGESGLLCHMASSYTFVAMEEVLLMTITQSDFDDFLKSNYSNARNIIMNLAKENATMKCNLDMLMNELAESQSKSSRGNVNQLRAHMLKHAINDYQKSLLFNNHMNEP